MEQQATQTASSAHLLVETLTTIWKNYQNAGDDNEAKVSNLNSEYFLLIKYAFVSVTLDGTFSVLFSICGGQRFRVRANKKASIIV